MENKLYPAKSIEIIAWYISTGLWVISISEAESVDALTACYGNQGINP